MATAKDLIQAAEKYLGITENPAGSNNVIFNTRYYGREVSGSAYPWCCAFQWCLFQDVGAAELFYGGGRTASCTTQYNWYRRQGQTVSRNDLRPGDLVFFVFDGNKNGVMNHIGLCVAVEEGYVTTIDGNTGNGNEANGGAVMKRRRAWRYVGGAVRPAYETEREDEEMKLYHYVAEMPEWAQSAATKAINRGVIGMDDTGAVNVYEVNLQTIVWLDRMGLLDGEMEV